MKFEKSHVYNVNSYQSPKFDLSKCSKKMWLHSILHFSQFHLTFFSISFYTEFSVVFSAYCAMKIDIIALAFRAQCNRKLTLTQRCMINVRRPAICFTLRREEQRHFYFVDVPCQFQFHQFRIDVLKLVLRMQGVSRICVKQLKYHAHQ